MRRSATLISASLTIVVAVGGCAGFGKKKLEMQPTTPVVTGYDSPVQEPVMEAQAYPTYGSPIPVESAYGSQPATLLAAGGTATDLESRYHIVIKQDTLYALARTYYGDQRRWKDIYEANRLLINDPNRISVGQRLVIPN